MKFVALALLLVLGWFLPDVAEKRWGKQRVDGCYLLVFTVLSVLAFWAEDWVGATVLTFCALVSLLRYSYELKVKPPETTSAAEALRSYPWRNRG